MHTNIDIHGYFLEKIDFFIMTEIIIPYQLHIKNNMFHTR